MTRQFCFCFGLNFIFAAPPHFLLIYSWAECALRMKNELAVLYKSAVCEEVKIPTEKIVYVFFFHVRLKNCFVIKGGKAICMLLVSSSFWSREMCRKISNITKLDGGIRNVWGGARRNSKSLILAFSSMWENCSRRIKGVKKPQMHFKVLHFQVSALAQRKGQVLNFLRWGLSMMGGHDSSAVDLYLSNFIFIVDFSLQFHIMTSSNHQFETHLWSVLRNDWNFSSISHTYATGWKARTEYSEK